MSSSDKIGAVEKTFSETLHDTTQRIKEVPRSSPVRATTSVETSKIGNIDRGVTASANWDFRIIEVEGFSPFSWDDAISRALTTASRQLSELFKLEVIRQTADISHGQIKEYRAVVQLYYRHEKPEKLSSSKSAKSAADRKEKGRSESDERLRRGSTEVREQLDEVAKHYEEIHQLASQE